MATLSLTRLLLLIICLVAFLILLGILFWPKKDSHLAHRQLAEDAAQNTIPGLQGDKNLRYSVSFIPPESVQTNQDTELHFF